VKNKEVGRVAKNMSRRAKGPKRGEPGINSAAARRFDQRRDDPKPLAKPMASKT